MEFTVEAVYTAPGPIPHPEHIQVDPSAVFTDTDELRIRLEVIADDFTAASTEALLRADAVITARYGSNRPVGLVLGKLTLTTDEYSTDHTPGLPGVWMSATDIAKHLNRSLPQVLQSIVTKPDFPPPITDRGKKLRLWPAAETAAWCDRWLANRR